MWLELSFNTSQAANAFKRVIQIVTDSRTEKPSDKLPMFEMRFGRSLGSLQTGLKPTKGDIQGAERTWFQSANHSPDKIYAMASRGLIRWPLEVVMDGLNL